MTQYSWPWRCAPPVGDASAYDEYLIENAYLLMGNIDPEISGPLFWRSTSALQLVTGSFGAINGNLAPTNPGGNTVRVSAGAGIVQGWLFINNADVDFNVGGGNANATDLIVLERGDINAVKTVRLAHVRGPVGGVATVTQNATTWQVPIAQVLLDAGGNFSALTDVRLFANRGYSLIERGTVGASSVTFSNIPVGFRSLALIATWAASPTPYGLRFRFNGDTGANYNDTDTGLGVTGINWAFNTINTNTLAYVEAKLPHYSVPNNFKILRADGYYSNAEYSAAGRWNNATAGINTIEVALLGSGANFIGNSNKFDLYGIV